MDYQVRSFSCFFEGKKLGQFTGGTYHAVSGDEPNFGDNGGLVVYSDGVIQGTLDSNVFIPVSGLDFDLYTAFLTKTNVNVSVGLVNGKILQGRMRILEFEVKGEIKAGKCDGSFKFGGGAPQQAPG